METQGSKTDEGKSGKMMSVPLDNGGPQPAPCLAPQEAASAASCEALDEAVTRRTAKLEAVNEDLKSEVEDKGSDLRLGLEALRVSHRVLHHLPVAVVAMDRDGLVVAANGRASTLPLSEKTISVGDLCEDVFPESIVMLVKQSLLFGKVDRLPHWHAGGATLSVTCAPIEVAGGPKGVLLVWDHAA